MYIAGPLFTEYEAKQRLYEGEKLETLLSKNKVDHKVINPITLNDEDDPDLDSIKIFKNDFMESAVPESVQPYTTLIVIIILTVITKLILDFYMNSKSGFLLRAVGDNDKLVTALAKDEGNMKILGLAIANGLISLSGCIFCQEERVFEISMGTGAVVIGLASVIIGTSLFRGFTFIKATFAVILGSVLYKGCTAVAMRSFEPQDMKFITAALFLIVLLISMERKKKVKIDA